MEVAPEMAESASLESREVVDGCLVRGESWLRRVSIRGSVGRLGVLRPTGVTEVLRDLGRLDRADASIMGARDGWVAGLAEDV